MNNDATGLLQDWLPFFTTLTVACATLAGLLFVALSLHASVLRSSQNSNLRRLASHTFGDFVTIMFIGLFFIAPWPYIYYVCIGMAITVAVAASHAVRRWLEVLTDKDNVLHRGYFIARLRLTSLALLLLIAGTVLMFLVDVHSPDYRNIILMIFGGSVILLISAMKSAWYLLAHELNRDAAA